MCLRAQFSQVVSYFFLIISPRQFFPVLVQIIILMILISFQLALARELCVHLENDFK